MGMILQLSLGQQHLQVFSRCLLKSPPPSAWIHMVPLPLLPSEILNYRLKRYVDFWSLILQFSFHWESTLLFNGFLEGELKTTGLQRMQTAIEEINTVGFP